MKLRIQYVLPLFLLFACDKVERDWSKCAPGDQCLNGYMCTDASTCVRVPDGGPDVAAAADASGREVVGGLEVGGGSEVSSGREVAGGDAVDGAVDSPVDAPADAAQFDTEPDATVDTRPVDGLGSCGVDRDCPASAPMCLNFRCAKCASNSDCSGAGAGVCEPTSGKCVACVKSSECMADPTKPVCVANQCAACSSAASECEIKNSAAPVCQTTSGKCVGCVTTSDCVGDADGGVDGGADGGVLGGFCNTTTNQCVGCLGSRDCTDPSKPICGTTETCVACGSQLAPVDGCTTKNAVLPVCKAAAGTCVECGGSGDCRADAGLSVCDLSTNKCVECNGPSDCAADPAKGFCVNHVCAGCQAASTNPCTGTKPVCSSGGTYAGQCVECNVFGDCKVGTKPVCDANQCRACAKDSDCTNISPAVVCGLDGSCPGDNAVIYLQNSASCSSNLGSGTSASPFCSSDAATGALTAIKTVIVVKGNGVAYPVGPLTIGAVASPHVLVAGQSSAKIANLGVGSHILVNITAGDVTLRDLTISGGNDAGVSVSGGATLHMDRCYVLNNQGVGIQTSASAFDVVNTVVAGNGAAAGGYGVSLGNYSGSPTRFVFNTVVNNVGGGVFCGTTSSYAIAAILASGNDASGGPNISTACGVDSTSSTATPNLVSSTNYHLTATSPCVDHGGDSCPPDDIDGDTRPQGAHCDCGADEYKP